MLSTSLELLGLAAIAAGVYVLAGLGVMLLAAGVELLFVGYAAQGVHPARSAVAHARAWRAGRARRVAQEA